MGIGQPDFTGCEEILVEESVPQVLAAEGGQVIRVGGLLDINLSYLF
jgi:hypothetical protein